tara:strand:+ start:1250 stop:1714 length:465 start_codon:yes stop_codon:yes gene_type:complete
MNIMYIHIYNNLIKLTRNKNLYNYSKQDTFYDRMIIFFFHIGFLLKNYKKIESKDNLQKFFDFCIKQLELSIREIGYGDATINKKMKDYINLLFSLIDKIDDWENLNNNQKEKIIKEYVDEVKDYNIFLDYIEKYRSFLAKNSFKNLSKDIINL